MGLVAPQHVGSSRTGDRTLSPALAGGFFTAEPPGKPHLLSFFLFFFFFDSYLFIWLHQVLVTSVGSWVCHAGSFVAALGLSSGLSCSMARGIEVPQPELNLRPLHHKTDS